MSNAYETGVSIVDPAEAERQMEVIRDQRAKARRNFLKNVGLAGAGVAAGVVLQGCTGGSSTTSAATPSQTDVLNFALNLEYLEAEFYSFATTGSAFNSAITGVTGTATGGKITNWVTPGLQNIANEIASDEQNHVKFLRNALGQDAVAEPTITLAAMDGTEPTFLALARAFEDTGVSAYGGAATLLTADNLQYAAQILATEAYHAGNLRLRIILNGQNIKATDGEDIPPSDPSHYFPVDANSLALIRTPSQVLAIVYGNSASGTNKGGFYPNGVNGNINTV
jgi:ferritin-like protein